MAYVVLLFLMIAVMIVILVQRENFFFQRPYGFALGDSLKQTFPNDVDSQPDWAPQKLPEDLMPFVEEDDGLTFENVKFSPHCCTATHYSSSQGCACMPYKMRNLLRSRGGNSSL